MISLRLGLVGPLHPYRGGIAAHTTRLRRELIELDVDVVTHAFCNPFPRILYPGEHVGNLAVHPERLHDVEYCLTYRWPRDWSTVYRALSADPVDAVIIPWWTFFFSLHVGWLSRKLQARGVPTVFLCHNLFDHEAAFYKKAATRWALREAAGFIFHSPDEAEKARQCFGEQHSLLFPHPLYDHFQLEKFPKDHDPSITRLLFFGLVRAYKGLEDLIDAFEQMHLEDLELTVAGEWWGRQEKLKNRCRGLASEGRLRLIDRFLTNQEAAAEFHRCDLVVLPYRRATNSGVLAHAIHECKPVVATRTGGLPLSVIDGKTGFLAEPENPASLAQAMEDAVERIRSGHDFNPAIKELASTMSWKEFSEKIVAFIDELILKPS